METSTKTFAAIETEQATLFVALELSQATWLVALHSPIADKISLHRIDGGDTGKLLALIERKREQAARRSVGRCGSSPATRRAVTASGCTSS